MITNNEEEYTVTTGNIVSNEKAEIIKGMLDKFNSLDADGIKAEYKKMGMVVDRGEEDDATTTSEGKNGIARLSCLDKLYHLSGVSVSV